jgi:hypothetical protein
VLEGCRPPPEQASRWRDPVLAARTSLPAVPAEHLSFRLGNQLFFVRIEDVDGKTQGPGTSVGLLPPPGTPMDMPASCQ